MMDSLMNAFFGEGQQQQQQAQGGEQQQRQRQRQQRQGRRRRNNARHPRQDTMAADGSWGGFVENFLAQAAQAIDPDQPQQPQQVPPASQRALRQLPTITVTPQDLVEESNRECCICFEPHSIGDKVTRLPCAHIFHSHCITDWLKKKCTCPICRYELPTDNPEYERSRVLRMQQRKPRYARYELERLTLRELQSLATRLRLAPPPGALEKSDLIQQIVDSGRIELIAAPEPVKYRLSQLQKMGISQLKHAMQEAGVFFDPRDVVEKDDMVRIFVNSGRVDLEREEEEDDDHAEEDNYMMNNDIEPDDDDEMEENDEDGFHASSATVDTTNGDVVEVEDVVEETRSVPRTNDDAQEMFDTPHEWEASGEPQNEPPRPYTLSHRTSYRNVPMSNANPFAHRSVAELRALAVRFGVDLSDCLEKREMVEKLARVLGS